MKTFFTCTVVLKREIGYRDRWWAFEELQVWCFLIWLPYKLLLGGDQKQSMLFIVKSVEDQESNLEEHHEHLQTL